MMTDWIGRESPSVADAQAFDELPLEIQSLARRVLLFGMYDEEIVEEWIFHDVQVVRRGGYLPWESRGGNADTPAKNQSLTGGANGE